MCKAEKKRQASAELTVSRKKEAQEEVWVSPGVSLPAWICSPLPAVVGSAVCRRVCRPGLSCSPGPTAQPHLQDRRQEAEVSDRPRPQPSLPNSRSPNTRVPPLDVGVATLWPCPAPGSANLELLAALSSLSWSLRFALTTS